MKESELEVLLSRVIDGFRTAFFEAEKKGAANHALVMEYLDRLIIELGKVRREYASAQEETIQAKDLQRKIREHVKDVAAEIGIPDQAKIFKKIRESSVTMSAIAKQEHRLAERGAREAMKDEIRRYMNKSPKAEDGRQSVFYFYSLAQFSRVKRIIRYVDPDTHTPIAVAYEDSLDKHRDFRIAQLKDQYERHTASYKKELEIEVEAQKELKALVKIYGDLTPPQLIAKRDKKKYGNGNGA